jgi:hypothetical protein
MGAVYRATDTKLNRDVAVKKAGASRKDSADVHAMGDALDKEVANAKSATDAGRMRALAAILKSP